MRRLRPNPLGAFHPLLAESNVWHYLLRAMHSGVPRASAFITDLAARGRNHFGTGEAADALGVTLPAVRAALRRLKRKGEIADPYRGFHVIVPPEYRRLGCLPANQFIGQLMEHLGEPYYVALLSAAELHGAAHQPPQGLQVMVKLARRPLVCGEVHVQFVARRDLESTAVIERRTPRGPPRVASAASTALELVGYADRCGGLDNVASVVAELAETLDGHALVAAARSSPISWVQRLGYLLDLAERRKLADALVPLVAKRARVLAPLVRSRSVAGTRRLARWKLSLNATVEPDP